MNDYNEDDFLAEQQRASAEFAADVDRLRAEVEALRAKAAAFDEWHAKTEWVQTTVKPRELGLHRADAMRMRIEALQAGLDAAINAARAAQGGKHG